MGMIRRAHQWLNGGGGLFTRYEWAVVLLLYAIVMTMVAVGAATGHL